jgi:myo-inositol-1(or 4)-monophosphatase
MHPYVNYSIKLLRDLGKKTARYFDETSEYKTQAAVSFQQSPANFVKSVSEKLHDELLKAYPDHYITPLFELDVNQLQEFGDQEIWAYQTVCGFNNFSSNIPFFCMTLIHIRQGQIQHAIVYDPLRDEAFNASKGSGAQVNNRRLRIIQQPEIRLVYTNDVSLLAEHPLQKNIRSFGSSNLELCYLAANRGELAIISSKNPLSIAAGKLIAREAGATCFVHQHNHQEQVLVAGALDHVKPAIDFIAQK